MKYWAGLSGRERVLIGVAVAMLSLLISWQFIVKPLVAFGPKQEKAYQASQADLKIMKDGLASLSITPVQNKSDLPIEKLIVEVTKSAGDSGLIISRRQPNGDTGISLWFEAAQSQIFYHWLDELTKTHHVTLQRANINRNNDGTIQAQITLKLGA